jgi:hypothetical protein
LVQPGGRSFSRETIRLQRTRHSQASTDTQRSDTLLVSRARTPIGEDVAGWMLSGWPIDPRSAGPSGMVPRGWLRRWPPPAENIHSSNRYRHKLRSAGHRAALSRDERRSRMPEDLVVVALDGTKEAGFMRSHPYHDQLSLSRCNTSLTARLRFVCLAGMEAKGGSVRVPSA